MIGPERARVSLARGDKTRAGAKASGANGKFLAPPNDWATQLAAGVNEPGRNDFIARLSGHLLRHHVDAHVVVELMLAFGAARCRPPLSEDEVTKIVNSIAAAELRKRQCKTT